MKLPLRCALLSISLLIAASCSHNVTTELPAAPTAVTPQVRISKLTITPPGGGTMIVGSSVPLTTSGPLPSNTLALGAFAQYTDGSGKYVDATWASSDASVAVVRDNSLVAIGRGTATLTASAEGMSATETFTIEPGIPGLWTGNYVVDSCQAGSASVEDFVCAAPGSGRAGGFLRPGTAAPILMQITQNGRDLSATTQFGDVRGVLTGVDAGANYFSFAGTMGVNQTSVRVVALNGRVRQDTMEGVLAFEITINGLPSWAAVSGHFDKVTRR